MLNKKKVGELEMLMDEMAQETLIHRLTERERKTTLIILFKAEDSSQMVAKV